MPHVDKQNHTEPHSKKVEQVRLAPNRLNTTLTAETPPDGMAYCWVGDENNGGNLQAYIDAGYTFVSRGTRTSAHVAPDSSEREFKNAGQGIKQYLMQIPKEIQTMYKKDAAKRSRDILAQIDNHTPNASGVPGDAEGLSANQIKQRPRLGFR